MSKTLTEWYSETKEKKVAKQDAPQASLEIEVAIGDAEKDAGAGTVACIGFLASAINVLSAYGVGEIEKREAYSKASFFIKKAISMIGEKDE